MMVGVEVVTNALLDVVVIGRYVVVVVIVVVVVGMVDVEVWGDITDVSGCKIKYQEIGFSMSVLLT